MGELDLKRHSAKADVSLTPLGARFEDLLGKEYACPLCADGLAILTSKRGELYCVCYSCGIQIVLKEDRQKKDS